MGGNIASTSGSYNDQTIIAAAPHQMTIRESPLAL